MQKGKSEGQNMRIIIIDRITNVCEMRNEVAEETAFYLIFHFYFSFLTPKGKAHRV